MAEHQTPRRGMRGGPGAFVPGEKAKNFGGTIRKLLRYIGSYRAAVCLVALFAVGSTLFNIAGPKVLGSATTRLAAGLQSKIAGTGAIDFPAIARILLFALGLYLISAGLVFLQSWLMTGITQKICYRMRREIVEKIDRMPMRYFETRTYGEVLSRITNDVDTLSMGLNQSVTQLITSVTTILGVLVMMLSISPLMTALAVVLLPLSVGLISLIIRFSQK